MQNELQFAVFEVCRDLIRILGSVIALVPNHDRPRPILAFRNIAFKTSVFQGMILNRHREPFDSRIERRSFGHCPGLQYAANLKPEIVMKISPLMLLNNKERAGPA
jgi:hypothetical protein